MFKRLFRRSAPLAATGPTATAERAAPVIVTERATPAATTAPVQTAPSVDRGRLSLLFLRRLIGTPTTIDPGPADAECLILEELARRVADRPLPSEMVPRLPTVLPRVLRAMRDPACDAGALAEIIAGDTSLVAEVVRLANSPAYGGVGRIESLQQAVVRLGDDGVRRLLLAATMRPIIDVRGGLLGREGGALLWEKNQHAATAADFLARRLAAPRFPAFLSGLVSQAGLLVLARALAASGQPGFIAASDAFLARLDTLARQVTSIVCEDWEMPEDVVRATAGLGGGEQDDSPLVTVVDTADLLARITVLERSGDLSEPLALDAQALGHPFAGACLDELRALRRANERSVA